MGIVAVVTLSLGFYGGMKYGESQSSSAQADSGARRGNGNFGMVGGGRRGGAGGGFVAGEIVSKDEKSITIKSNDGGSKIVFYSGTTKVMESVEGSLTSITVGKQVVANGSSNPDGSVTAQSIQIRPLSPGRQQNNNQ